jgi:hypothetical protein
MVPEISGITPCFHKAIVNIQNLKKYKNMKVAELLLKYKSDKNHGTKKHIS